MNPPADSATMQEKTFRLYSALIQSWKSSLPEIDGLSAPFLPFPSSAFASSLRRLLVVGQQTNGWISTWADCRDKETDILVGELTEAYELWYAKADYQTPFFQALDELASGFEPSATPRNHCLWANVLPFDQDGEMVSASVGEILGKSTPVLPTLLTITKPQAVVFLCGHHYDSFLRHQFPDLRISPEENNGRVLSRLQSPMLPAASFRTYHPAYLQRTHQWDILQTVTRLIHAD
jgi:hypothetical protein